jgi:excisionase family DNA binding protein
MSDLGRAWLDDIAGDQVALARLRELVAVHAPEPEPFITVNEAAKKLRCHPKTVRRRIAAGVFSAVRDQGRVLLRAGEVDTYLEGVEGASSSSRRRRRRSRDLGLDFLRE